MQVLFVWLCLCLGRWGSSVSLHRPEEKTFSRSGSVQLGDHWDCVRWPPPYQQMAQSPAVSPSSVSGVATWAVGQMGHGRIQREGWGTSPMPRTKAKHCTVSFNLKKLFSRCSDNWFELRSTDALWWCWLVNQWLLSVLKERNLNVVIS